MVAVAEAVSRGGWGGGSVGGRGAGYGRGVLWVISIGGGISVGEGVGSDSGVWRDTWARAVLRALGVGVVLLLLLLD